MGARFANGFTSRTYTTPGDTTRTGSVKPGKIGGHVPPKIRGTHREWVLQKIEAGGDVTLQGLADGLAERGLKVDYRTMWNFVHREGKRFKKTVFGA